MRKKTCTGLCIGFTAVALVFLSFPAHTSAQNKQKNADKNPATDQEKKRIRRGTGENSAQPKRSQDNPGATPKAKPNAGNKENKENQKDQGLHKKHRGENKDGRGDGHADGKDRPHGEGHARGKENDHGHGHGHAYGKDKPHGEGLARGRNPEFEHREKREKKRREKLAKLQQKKKKNKPHADAAKAKKGTVPEEQRKHLHRMARITRLLEIAGATQNDALRSKVLELMNKEKKRHQKTKKKLNKKK